MLLGLTAAIKLTPLIFVPFLLLSRQTRTARNTVTTFVLCTLGMFAVNPSASWQYWFHDAFDVVRVGKVANSQDQNLRYAILRVAHVSGAVIDLLTLGCLVFGIWVAVRAYRESSPLLGFLVCGFTGLIVSPVSWSHHYIWVVPALFWLVFAADRPRHGRWWALPSAFVCFNSYGALTKVIWPSTHAGVVSAFVANNPLFLFAVAFVVLTAVLLRRRRRVANDMAGSLVGSLADEAMADTGA